MALHGVYCQDEPRVVSSSPIDLAGCPLVGARYDWRERANKPLLRHLSFVFKPVFKANHRWAMARGEEGLRRELARRRDQSGRD